MMVFCGLCGHRYCGDSMQTGGEKNQSHHERRIFVRGFDSVWQRNILHLCLVFDSEAPLQCTKSTIALSAAGVLSFAILLVVVNETFTMHGNLEHTYIG